MTIPCDNCGYFPDLHSLDGSCPAPEGSESRTTYSPALIDIHTKIAMDFFGGRPDTITPDMRWIAGIINCGN